MNFCHTRKKTGIAGMPSGRTTVTFWWRLMVTLGPLHCRGHRTDFLLPPCPHFPCKHLQNHAMSRIKELIWFKIKSPLNFHLFWNSLGEIKLWIWFIILLCFGQYQHKEEIEVNIMDSTNYQVGLFFFLAYVPGQTNFKKTLKLCHLFLNSLVNLCLRWTCTQY